MENSKTLKLIVEKRWFDMILSGVKKEEYRNITPYWLKRLMTKHDTDTTYKHFDYVEFINGYGNHRPKVTMECQGISEGIGKMEWGSPMEDCFVIKLGREISRSNC